MPSTRFRSIVATISLASTQGALGDADSLVVEALRNPDVELCARFVLEPPPDSGDGPTGDLTKLRATEIKLCDVEKPPEPPRLHATLSSFRTGLDSTETSGTGNGEGAAANEGTRFSTVHAIDLNYDGVRWDGQPAKHGSLSFGASLDLHDGGGDLNLFGGIFKNSKGEVYRPYLVPIGWSFGGGLWLADSERNGTDLGGLARVEGASSAGKRFGYGGRVDLIGNDRIDGRSATATLATTGYLDWRHGRTAHDALRLSGEYQHHWLEGSAQGSDDVSTALVSATASTRVIEGIYLELGGGHVRTEGDSNGEDATNEKGWFYSVGLVFRRPFLAKKPESTDGYSVPFYFDTLRNTKGATQVGGSAARSGIFDRLSRRW